MNTTEARRLLARALAELQWLPAVGPVLRATAYLEALLLLLEAAERDQGAASVFRAPDESAVEGP